MWNFDYKRKTVKFVLPGSLKQLPKSFNVASMYRLKKIV